MSRKSKRRTGRTVDMIQGAFANEGDAREAHEANRKLPRAIGGRVYRICGLWVWEVVFPLYHAPKGVEATTIVIDNESAKQMEIMI